MRFRIGLAAAAMTAVIAGGMLSSGCCLPSSLSDKIGDKVGDSITDSVEKNIEKETGVDVETEDTAETSGKDLQSVPRYPDSKRTFYIKGEPIDGDISISITYESTDATAKVNTWYKDKMASLGWAVGVAVGGTDGGEMITYQKNDSEITATVSVTKEGDKTGITIMYNGPEAGA